MAATRSHLVPAEARRGCDRFVWNRNRGNVPYPVSASTRWRLNLFTSNDVPEDSTAHNINTCERRCGSIRGAAKYSVGCCTALDCGVPNSVASSKIALNGLTTNLTFGVSGC